MMLKTYFGFPSRRKIADDAHRFWYWTGASGRRYIHSVYPIALCPPLPGAVYLAVRREGDRRTVLAINRFDTIWQGNLSHSDHVNMLGNAAEIHATEIHVYLLAKDTKAAEAVRQDLALALMFSPQQHATPSYHETNYSGFHEQANELPSRAGFSTRHSLAA